MHCHKVEMHGLSQWTLVSKADCAVGIFDCWYVNVSKPVPNFAKPTQSPYFRGDCGKCPAKEKSCVSCSEPYCNFKAKKPPRILYNTDLMGQLSPVWVLRLTPFEYRLRKSRESKNSQADYIRSNPHRPRIRVTVSSDMATKAGTAAFGFGAGYGLLPPMLLPLLVRGACSIS